MNSREIDHVTAYTLEIVGGRRLNKSTLMAKTTRGGSASKSKPKEVASNRKGVPQRKQKHVEEVQAVIETSAREAARAKRLARKAEVDEQESQRICEGIGADDDDSGIGTEDRQVSAQEFADLRVMVEGLTARLVETQTILSSFATKVEQLLLRGDEKGDDTECVVAEVDAASDVDDGPLKKHDSIFMRNVNISGSNLTVSVFAPSNKKKRIFRGRWERR
jgi:hypothetical protein